MIVEAAVAQLEQGIAVGPLDPGLSAAAVSQRDPAGEVVIDRSDRATWIDAAGCQAALELGAPFLVPDSGHEWLGPGTGGLDLGTRSRPPGDDSHQRHRPDQTQPATLPSGTILGQCI